MTDNSTDINNINKLNSPCLHDSWDNHLGAYFNSDNKAVFKIFTFPDVKNVKVEIKPVNKNIISFDLQNKGGGLWQLVIDEGIISHADRYRFCITYSNGDKIQVKDPCSMWQDSFFKWSKIYNHSLFNWSDKKWTCLEDERKISRLNNSINNLSSVQSLRIYELHIGTFTNEGTFKSAISKLEYIKNLNFNAIEIMPVENTYSFNWGYDGVDKYAPNHTYGTPDDLKELINAAHNLGLNVIMDVVPNHLGPDISELNKIGPYIECNNCFGYKFNFECENNSFVRDFITGSALNWLINYHCDGLRVDMTKFCCSDYTLKQLVAEIHYHSPHSFLIAEDGRDNDYRVTRAFTDRENEENINNHKEFIEQIKNNNISLANLGFDSEWDFLFHKQIISSFLGVWDCKLKNLCDFDSSLTDAATRVKYIMSHDEIGNVDGTRLITKIMVNELKLEDIIFECSSALKSKRLAHAAHNILISLVSGNLEKMSDKARTKFYIDNYITEYIPVETVFYAYLNAVRMHKTALGKVYSIPGPKMVFQGDEEGNLSYFKFFRKFSSGPEPNLWEKGYEPGLKAFLDSKLDSVKFDDKYKPISDAVRKYCKDLNDFASSNPALINGNIEKTLFHKDSDIHGIYVKNDNNEIVSISNFSNKSYYKNYGMLFPKGCWSEVLHSDDIKYMGSGKYHNENKIIEQYNYISIPAYSIIFFKRV